MSQTFFAAESIVSVGLDVHQYVVQVRVLNRTGQVLSNRRVANPPRRMTALLAAIRGHGGMHGVALECSTGTATLAGATDGPCEPRRRPLTSAGHPDRDGPAPLPACPMVPDSSREVASGPGDTPYGL